MPIGLIEMSDNYEAARHARGTYFEFMLSETDHCFKSANEKVTCCATDDSSTIFLYEDGDLSYTSGLPHRLYKQLHTRARNTPMSPSVPMIAFSSGSRKAKSSGTWPQS